MLYMLLQMATLSVSLKLYFRCIWPLQNSLEGRNVFTIKPLFRSCMYVCTCVRIFIQSAQSNLYHVKIKDLFVSLCS